MTMPRRLLLTVVALSTLALPLRAIDLPPARDRWITLRADEFQIFSNASERTTASIAKQLVDMRDALGKVTQLKVRSPLPTRVYIFWNERSFAPWRDAAMQHEAPNTTGVFVGGENGNLILIRGDAPGGVDGVIFHELTHYFVKNTVASIPLWANEGIAEYYSTFSTSGDDVQVGKAIPEHVLWLRQQSLIPLRDLFATDEKSPNYNERSRQGVFYAESWALMHYLMLGNPERHDQLGRFLGLINAQKPLDEAFRSAFATTYEDLERELRGYVRRMSFSYITYRGADLHRAELPEPSPMTHAEVLYQLGHLLAWSGPRALPDGETFLNAALSADPSLAGAYADLGRLQAMTGRREEAVRSFDRATALGTGEADIYLYYAGTILERLFATRRGKADAADIDKARGLLLKSTELDPKSARAWAGLGAAYLLAEDSSAAGIAALERSLALAPAQEDVAFNLVQMYAHAGRRDDASRLIDSVIVPAGDAKRIAEARETLVRMDVNLITKLLHENKRDEAVALAKKVATQTNDPEVRAYVDQFVNGVEGRKNAAEKLTLAISQANAGKYTEAIALVDEVLPTLTDASMIEYAKKFRGELVDAAANRPKTRKH